MSDLIAVRQDSLTTLGDGQTPPVPLARMGFPAALSKWDLLALSGRMFNLKQTTIGTAVAGSAADAGAIVLTAPTIGFTVPVGTTVFPRKFNLAFATAGGTDNEIAICSTSSDTYVSGGTAVTPRNWRTDNPRASAVTNCAIAAGAAIVETTLVGVRSLYQGIIPLAFAAGESFWNTVIKWDEFKPIIGPARFLIWVSAATSASTIYFSLDWAEVPTISVKAG